MRCSDSQGNNRSLGYAYSLVHVVIDFSDRKYNPRLESAVPLPLHVHYTLLLLVNNTFTTYFFFLLKEKELIPLNQFLPPPNNDVELRQNTYIIVVPEGISYLLSQAC